MELDWHNDSRCHRDGLLLDTNDVGVDRDLGAVCRYRLERFRTEMAKRDIAACVLFDPVNIRYASGARNMQIFNARNPARYLLVTQDQSAVILYEFAGCMHLADDLELVTEVRPAITASFVAAGDDIKRRELDWASEVASTLIELVGKGATVGIERINVGAVQSLSEYGFLLVDAQQPIERARAIKSSEEVSCVRASLHATEIAVARLRHNLRPGLTENALWSILHQAVIAQNGDYVETRLLSSGQRTNPWFQESGTRVIGENELVALDTDVVGCYGYYADFSRTFHSGPDEPSAEQRRLYAAAYEQIHHNMQLLNHGLTFREYAEQAWKIPEKYFANRYYVSAHGVGMTGEYPYLYHGADFVTAGYDGHIEVGMTLCVESYIGEVGGCEGVKLEQQVLVTPSGPELLSNFPFEASLLAG